MSNVLNYEVDFVSGCGRILLFVVVVDVGGFVFLVVRDEGPGAIVVFFCFHFVVMVVFICVIVVEVLLCQWGELVLLCLWF